MAGSRTPGRQGGHLTDRTRRLQVRGGGTAGRYKWGTGGEVRGGSTGGGKGGYGGEVRGGSRGGMGGRYGGGTGGVTGGRPCGPRHMTERQGLLPCAPKH